MIRVSKGSGPHVYHEKAVEIPLGGGEDVITIINSERLGYSQGIAFLQEVDYG